MGIVKTFDYTCDKCGFTTTSSDDTIPSGWLYFQGYSNLDENVTGYFHPDCIVEFGIKALIKTAVDNMEVDQIQNSL